MNWIHISKTCESFSAYNFAILPVILLWWCLRDFYHQHGWSRSHKATPNKFCMALEPGACQACFEEPLLRKHDVQRGFCWTGWRSPPACGSGQPSSSLRCVCSRQISCSPFHALLPTAAPRGFGLASSWTRQLQGPHFCSRCLQPSHHLSGFVLPSECPLNLPSHTPNSPHVRSPLQIKHFEMKVQSCSNNHINYLFHWGKRWVKSSSSNMEELLVSVAKIIFPTGLFFHNVTWPKGVCTRDQVRLKTKQQHSTWHCLVCRT